MTLRSPTKAATMHRPVPPRGLLAHALVQQRLGSLTHQIEAALGQDVLPRLQDRRLPSDTAELERLTTLAMAGDGESLSQIVNQKRRTGESSEQICLTMLTEVAQRLGQWWAEDRCGFVEVTLGMVVLHQLLREVAPSLRRGAPGHHRRTALILPMPGEQHGFGAAMVAEFFRAAGWYVAQDGGRSARGLARRVGQDWFGVVALSCGVTDRLAELPALIELVRAHSFNPEVAVMVGGQAFAADPGTAVACGADACAADAAEALRRAEQLVGLMAALP